MIGGGLCNPLEEFRPNPDIEGPRGRLFKFLDLLFASFQIVFDCFHECLSKGFSLRPL